MKIRLLSDLHLEMSDMILVPAGEDVLILAGDIATYIDGIVAANEIARNFNVPVIVIAGNHEYYRNDINTSHTWEKTIEDISKEADHTNEIIKGETTFFENNCAVYEGVRFIGATLWTDMNLYGDRLIAERVVRQYLNDYNAIWSKNNHPITTSMVITRHEESLSFITEKLSEKFDGPTIVITHHAPSSLSVPEKYKDSRVSAAYASRLEDLILDHEPTLWLHGHTHTCFDYQLGNTRIVVNPRGYDGFEYTGYDLNLIIEI